MAEYIYTLTKTAVEKIFSVTFAFKSADAADIAQFGKYGPPTADFGGSFPDTPAGSPDASNTFALPFNVKNLVTGLPHTQVFNGNTNLNAEAHAKIYETEVKARISTSITAVRGITATLILGTLDVTLTP